MKKYLEKNIWRMASLCFFWAVSAQPLIAALSDYTSEQQAAFDTVAQELSTQNNYSHTAESIEPFTYWIDAALGSDESGTGSIDKPWKSILKAMYNVSFDLNEANIVVREGTYSPAVLNFGAERGGDSGSSSPFNLLAYPGEKVIIDGSNVTSFSALVTINDATNVTISGLEFSNVQGSGKSVIYVNNSTNITLSNNKIYNAKWTSDLDDSESPTLADRLNAIAILGSSTNIMINNNTLNDLVTGYGEPILVADAAQATLTNNSIEDVDADTFTGQHYFVSPEGNDTTGIGTIDKPWQTIHKALFTIPFTEDDATIQIRAGTYKIDTAMYFDEARGGSEGKYFTVKAYEEEEVIIDGSLLTTPFSAMASFSSTSYVRLKGLTFANLKGPKSAIYLEGTSHHIRIINNVLRDMTWVDGLDIDGNPAVEDPQSPKPSDNLNPIAIIGNNATQPVNNILIRGNTLFNIVPGYSEGIKVVGNVTDFVISRNLIHDIANIGIVAAGNYPWVADPITGVRIPDNLNHARNGVIRNNTVYNAISPIANSAGIYLDGARNVTVARNTSYNNSVGFSVGSEQPGDATGNILRRNVAYGNTDAGLVVGTVHEGAVVNNTTIINNEFRDNYTRGDSGFYGGEMTIQQVNGLKVNNNLFSSRSNVIIVVSAPATNLSLNNNLYSGVSNDPDTAEFDWGGISGTFPYVGFSKFQAETCHDLKSVYLDADTIQYLDKVKKKSAGKVRHKGKSGRSPQKVRRMKEKSNDKELSGIRRACYKASKIW